METNTSPSRTSTRPRPNYFMILVVLVVFTVLEVGASYIQGLIKIPILLILAATKATLVVLYFMHLKFDSRWFALWFILALALLTPLIVYLGLPRF